MDDLFRRILVLIFVISTSLKTSESYNIDHNSPVIYQNRTLLLRHRRQAQGNVCKTDNTKFQCATTADCIDIDLQCDGKLDCSDGTDEKESLCKNFPCPGYLFKCEYGACISTDQKCDGVKDCIDNSDEVDCPVQNKVNTNCRSDQFECKNGQCIETDGKCNGIADCEDKSDETEELCLNVFCPGYTFKCKYGACVDGDAGCNDVQDCMDNSDEENCIKQVTEKPKPSGVKCRTPKQPTQGEWKYLTGGKGRENERVDVNTVITFSCNPGYKLSTTVDQFLPAICGPKGKWTVLVFPTCELLCPAQYNSPLITLTCKNDGSIVPCDKATDNTILTYKCAPYYERAYGRSESNVCVGGSWDYTPECVPVCGEKRVSATPLIVNGLAVERGNYPWVVALYSDKESSPYYTNICGGSLLKPDIVLTAAHCVTKKEGGKIYPARYYRVSAGKYYNQYGDARDNDTAQYAEVAEIKVNEEYKGEVQNFRGDIALLKLKTKFALSKVVQPVCFTNLPDLLPHSSGLVTGWGYTTSSGKPSDVLKDIELPFTDQSTCESELDQDFATRYLTPDKFCAGFHNKSTSVCKGDSGGGLVFRNPVYMNRFFIHGVVSLGHSFMENQEVHCNIQARALFTKVYKFSDWIQLTLRRWAGPANR